MRVRTLHRGLCSRRGPGAQPFRKGRALGGEVTWAVRQREKRVVRTHSGAPPPHSGTLRPSRECLQSGHRGPPRTETQVPGLTGRGVRSQPTFWPQVSPLELLRSTRQQLVAGAGRRARPWPREAGCGASRKRGARVRSGGSARLAEGQCATAHMGFPSPAEGLASDLPGEAEPVAGAPRWPARASVTDQEPPQQGSAARPPPAPSGRAPGPARQPRNCPAPWGQTRTNTTLRGLGRAGAQGPGEPGLGPARAGPSPAPRLGRRAPRQPLGRSGHVRSRCRPRTQQRASRTDRAFPTPGPHAATLRPAP